ncbi:thiamine-phosphate kinase [Trueperella bernardiae]|uniref:Thiamine-monophosphate kinase n=1 Tax=Trueperella bernardiae TaxID=59561 RepID=A0AAW6ZKJ6_9ACTO|nr:thiamine-phosphate kinase [Trueperella bernardiae]MDK8602165.1 thiamine-phosphate kinase [Trueperella bernardiae]
MLISHTTEDDLISRFLPLLPRGEGVDVPSGDDCAVLAMAGAAAISTDMLVEGHHFRRDWSGGADIGFRAAMQNLADAVAMGARPRTLVISLGLPGSLEVEWVEDFARGLAEACAPLGVGVDGGDLVGSEAIVIGVTVLGDMEGRAPLRRSDAQIGDRVIHAGNLGHGAAGLALLEAGVDIDAAVAGLVDDFKRPKPPLDAALAAAMAGGVTAMMDVSDGLVRDARRLAKASGVWIDFDPRSLERKLGPLGRAAGRLHADRREWLLTGGEDHGFIATIRPGVALPEGFIDIGEVMGASNGGRVTVGNREVAGFGGWDHFGAGTEE